MAEGTKGKKKRGREVKKRRDKKEGMNKAQRKEHFRRALGSRRHGSPHDRENS